MIGERSLLALGVIAFVVGCGVSAKDRENEQAGENPAPTFGEWVSATRVMICRPGDNAPVCIGPRFYVERDGKYRFDETDQQGNLRSDDLTRFIAAADRVAAQSLNVAPICTQAGPSVPEIAAVDTMLIYAGIDLRLFSFNAAAGRCVRGDASIAEAFDSEMMRLSQAYYQLPAPPSCQENPSAPGCAAVECPQDAKARCSKPCQTEGDRCVVITDDGIPRASQNCHLGIWFCDGFGDR